MITISASEKCERVYEREPKKEIPPINEILDKFEFLRQACLVTEKVQIGKQVFQADEEVKPDDEVKRFVYDRDETYGKMAWQFICDFLIMGKEGKQEIINLLYKKNEHAFNWHAIQAYKILDGRWEYNQISKTLILGKRRESKK